MRGGGAAGGLLFVVVCATTASALRIPIKDRVLELDGTAEYRHIEEVEDHSRDQRPFGRLRLAFGLDLIERLRAVAVVTGRAGGPQRDTRGAGILNFDDPLQDFSPSLDFEEAYLQYAPGELDLRAGLQKFGWGNLDSTQPNDLLNPERYNDPALEEEDERKIGVPALSASMPWPTWLTPPGLHDPRFTLVWEPIFVPPRIPDQDERWYPPLGRIPSQILLFGLPVATVSTVRNANLPERDIDNGAIALRFSGKVQRVDFSLYYFDGYDPLPVYDVAARAFVRADVLDPNVLILRSIIDIVPDYQPIRSAGFDLAFPLGATTIRAEAAYIENRLYSRSVFDVVQGGELFLSPINPILLQLGIEQELAVDIGQINFPLDAVEWGIGIDTIWQEIFVLAQWNQTSIFGADRDLIISNQESRIVVTARRSFLDETLEAELNGLYGIQGVYGVVQPQVVYDLTDALDVTLGYLLIEGREESSVGQYKRNDEVYLKLRYFF